jgi:large subunit ribosomal protein L4
LSSVLFVGVDKEKDSNFCRASGNLQSVDVLPTAGINVYDILNHEYLVLTTDAVETITQRLA